MSLNLTQLGDGRPLLLTQPLGSRPRVVSTDMIDNFAVHTQRHSAVLTGEFSCCRMRHIVTAADGSETVIPCDRDQLRAVLRQLYDAALEVTPDAENALHSKRSAATQ